MGDYDDAAEFMRDLWRPSDDWVIRPGMAPEYRGPVADALNENVCPNGLKVTRESLCIHGVRLADTCPDCATWCAVPDLLPGTAAEEWDI